MEQLIGQVLDTSPTTIYLIVGLLAFCEAAVFVGLVVPGGVVAAFAGVLAAQGRVSLTSVMLVAVAGAIAGDSASYEIGRRWGPRLLRLPRARRHAAAVHWAASLLAQRGEIVVFVSRWTGLVGTLVPSVAGMLRMPYRRFLAANTLGGVAWGVLFPVLGYTAGASFHVVEGWLGGVSWVLAGLVVLAIAGRGVVARTRRPRERRDPCRPPDDERGHGVLRGAAREAGALDGAPCRRDGPAEPGAVGAADRVAS